MWYRRKMLLAAVVFTALCYKVTALKQLDMATQAVDALYNGCNKKALETVIHSGLLEQELNHSKEFQKVWQTKCSDLIPGGEKEHTVALMAYANAGKKFRKAFNDAVETMGGNVSTYENHFHFKSLHFLLMDAMRLLNKQKCENVYIMSGTTYKAQKGSKIRFGRFTSVQTDLSMKEDIDGGTYFNITTCFFASLGDFCNMDEDKGLISPTEEFTVVDVKTQNEYNEITLTHSELVSSHNCYSFSRSPAEVSTQWLVLVLVGFSLFHFNC